MESCRRLRLEAFLTAHEDARQSPWLVAADDNPYSPYPIFWASATSTSPLEFFF